MATKLLSVLMPKHLQLLVPDVKLQINTFPNMVLNSKIWYRDNASSRRAGG